VIWGGIHGTLLALERWRGRRAIYEHLPAPLRVGATFVVLLMTWVFFRARDVPHAVRYLGDMLGAGAPQDGSALLAGIVYQPYYAGTLAVAAAVVWYAPQAWDWTRSLTPVKAAAAVWLLALSAAILSTQAYNPFIYFIF
jgi:alginate O-acetyltransferase complex protein AlgI